MLNPLDLLVYVFFGMIAASIIGLAFQFIAKNKKLQKAGFYFSAALGVLLAYFKIQSTPLYVDWTGQIIIGLALGALAIAAVILQLLKKDDKAFLIARVMASVSVVGGMICTFFI